MSKKLFALLFVMLMLCGAALADGITVTDMHGREIALDQPATRIVALTPSDCEILCAIGCEDALVGRGKYCDYPESISALPVVQSGAETNIEGDSGARSAGRADERHVPDGGAGQAARTERREGGHQRRERYRGRVHRHPHDRRADGEGRRGRGAHRRYAGDL